MSGLVSIVVPVYNTEKYLERCINSIIVQTYTNLEIIIVDDGSTDGSSKLCDGLAQEDSRIRVIHKCNGGQSTARNTGVEIACGKYISFIDSDDYVHRDYISTLVKVKERVRAQIVQCGIRKVDSQSAITDGDMAEGKRILLSGKNAVLNREYKVSACAKIYDLHLFRSIEFPEGQYFEDEATYYKLAILCRNICIISEELYLYFQSPTSTTRNNLFRNDFIDVCEQRINFFINYGDKELIQNAYSRYAITTILNHASCKRKKIDKPIQEDLYDRFKKNYSYIDISMEKNEIRWLLATYYFCPNIVATIISILRR